MTKTTYSFFFLFLMLFVNSLIFGQSPNPGIMEFAPIVNIDETVSVSDTDIHKEPKIDTRKFGGAKSVSPVFESSNSVVQEEGVATTTTILDVNATDGIGGGTDANITYALLGTDAARFNINNTSGIITFAAIPDWSNPADADTNNVYSITVMANNNGSTTNQAITVYVFPKNGLTGTEIAQQVGGDIDGEAAGNLSGKSLSFSSDGKTVAIGAHLNAGVNGSASGHVRVYAYNGSVWTQLGTDIDGETAGDYSGTSVSLSADGKTVAIGATQNDGNGSNSGQVRVYWYNGSDWTQLGGDIDGEAASDKAGYSVSLSSDGKTVAIGAHPNAGVNGSNSGHVRVYAYNGSAWTQLGTDIDGEAANDELGYSVSISTDGKTVAIGARKNDGNGSDSGHVQIYNYNGSAWVQLGGDIDGEAAGDYLGYSVSLSADGKTVAIGATNNAGVNGSNSGHVRVYAYNGSAWTQLGTDIDGEAANDELGYSVSLSSDGTTVAIGARSNAGVNGSGSGHVRIYRLTSNTWTQVGADIDGEAASDQSGRSVSLSADGTTVAIGAPYNAGVNGTNSGHVRIYKLIVPTPVFESSNSVVQEEGTAIATTILDVNATDGSGGSTDTNVTYALSGTDASDFTIDANSGAIAFAAIPDWSNPADADTNNIYSFKVTATNHLSKTKDQDITVYVFPKNGLTGTEIAQQVGGDIDGEASYDYSGASVSFSADGKTVAIGAYYNDGNGAESGHVRIYTYNGSAWTQLGTDIDGEAAGDYSGTSVSLSADGKTVAIGATNNDGNGPDSGQVRVYTYNGSAWIQLGSDIDGEAAGDRSGRSVSLSSDGKTVAIGANGNGGNGSYSGHVRIYAYNGSAWAQLGTDIDGEASYDNLGRSVSLSSDGKTVAIGAYYNDGNGSDSGQVRIYTYNGSAWVQVGSDIDGEAAGDYSGISVSLSSNGKTVAIGASQNGGNGSYSGQVRVYTYANSVWTQVGTDIDGEAAGDRSGYSVSLSADGKTVAIGASVNDGNGTDSGHVRIYRFTSSTWVQVGADIDGEAAGDRTGNSVSLSADGKTVAISAYLNGGNGTNSGHVRIYKLIVPSPVFESSNSVTQEEGIATTSTILDVNATDGKGGSADTNVTYALSGTDASDFTIDANSGAIAFAAIPDWSNPADADTNNIYSFKVTATNHLSKTKDQDITVYVFPKNGLTGTEIVQQVGGDIDGEALGDNSGYSVSFSADGKTVAIGAYYNNGNGSRAGHVRIYSYKNSSWTQLGGDIDGEASEDNSGTSVSLSSDGKTVAIGARYNDANGSKSGQVRVYTYNGSAWTQLGSDIDGEAANDLSGWSVSLSSDGKTVAIGAIGNGGNGSYSGHVRIYAYNGSAWTQLGTDIDGEASYDNLGRSVSLSSDGKTIAIGANQNGGNGSYSGHVRIYTYNGSAWVQVGSDIDGEAASDYSGVSVSLSSDGKTVAIGANGNDGNGSDSGQVRVYTYANSVWTQVGTDIDGEAAGDHSGYSVSLSADGKTVAIGAYQNDENGTDSGHVRIYRFTNNTWKQVGADIDGETEYDKSGYSVSLSADGTTVAIGAPYNAGVNGNNSGQVRVYKLILDTTVPTLVSTSPSDDATGVAVGSNLTLTFSENMAKGTGNIVIYDALDDAVVATIAVTSDQVSITDKVVTINPTADLLKSKNYYVQVANTALKDASGNAFAGILDKTSFNFATELKATPTITFSNLSKTYGDAAFDLTATTSSSASISYSVVAGGTGAVTLSGKNVTITKAGTVKIKASVAANANYEAAAKEITLTINKGSLTVTANAQSKVYGATEPTLTYTITGFVNGDTEASLDTGVSISRAAGENAGTYVITPSGALDSNYSIAFVSKDFTITKATQTISFGALSHTQDVFDLTATSSSGLAVDYSSSNTAVATISGKTVTVLSGGVTNITARQSGDTNYHPATAVVQVLTVIRLGVDEDVLLSKTVQVYPNPATNFIHVDLGNINKAHIKIYSITGKQLLEVQDYTSKGVLNISSLKPGMYLLKIESDTASTMKKFIKK